MNKVDVQQKIIAVFADSLSAQLQTRIYMVPILLGVGIALYFIWPHEPGLVQPLLGTLFLGAAAWWLYGVEQGPSVRSMAVLSLMIVLAGFTSAKIRALYVQTPMIKTAMGPVGVEGRVQSLEQLEGGVGIRVILDELVIADLPPNETPNALRLSIRKGGERVKTGGRVRVFAKIEPASPPTTPGGFDFRRHAFFKQIGGYGYVLGAPKLTAMPEQGGYAGWFENTRNHISELVNKTLEPRQAGMVAALLTGERAAINKEDWQALRDSGLAHLLAISGANVDMVALIVFFIVRLALAAVPRIALYYPIKKIAAVAAFIAALSYVMLIYPSTPTLRALLMVGIVLFAILIDRSPISLRLVAVTAIVILIFQPEQLLSPSFQLSYAAVTALVAVFEWAGPWLKRVHADAGALKRGLIYLVGVCATTAIATLATAPISLYHFQTLAMYGVVANVLAVPLMTFLIMPLSILCYVMIPLGVAQPSLHVLGAACDWILSIAHITADQPGARLTPPAMPLSAFLLVIGAGLIVCLGARHLKFLAIMPLMGALGVVAAHEYPAFVVLQGGKVIMARLETGEVVTSTRRYARRQQSDWVRYWGGDDMKGARVVGREEIRRCQTSPLRGEVPSVSEGVGVDKICSFFSPPPGSRCSPTPPLEGEVLRCMSPIAVYTEPTPHAKVIGPRVTGRLWNE